MTRADAPAVVAELVADVTKLTSLPSVVMRIVAVLDDPRATSQQIVDVVQQDAAFAAHILRVANSAFFGASQHVDSLSKAITVLGTVQVRDMALGLAVAQTFQGVPNSLLSMRTFWNHSILCAICARLLAKEAHDPRAEVAFVSGLLHDVGKLVLATRAPDASRLALTAASADPVHRPLFVCEREVLGFDHADVGAELARRWQLPGNLVAAIEFHHEPARAGKLAYDASLVHIANALAHVAERDGGDVPAAPAVDPFAWRAAGLSDAVIARVVPIARAAVTEVKQLFNLVLAR